MSLTRTNITIPQEILELVDDLVGPRGRSRYISEAVARQVRRDRQAKVFRATFGAMIGKPGWMNPDEALAFAKRLRASWDDPSA